MNRKAKYKVAWFIVLLALYFVAAGSDLTIRMTWRLPLFYIIGAVMAFWAGGEPIGTLRPITMRPLCILIGSLFMIWAFTMTLFVREALHKSDRAPARMKTSAVTPAVPSERREGNERRNPEVKRMIQTITGTTRTGLFYADAGRQGKLSLS